MWRHFISPRRGKKNSNLDKINLPESPFIKTTYHIRGCMAFRSNEQGLTLIMAQFVETRPYRTRAWPLGWRGTPRRLIFVSSHEKCVFHFWSAEVGFFVRQVPKRQMESWAQDPHK
jgi:hypothetical protein